MRQRTPIDLLTSILAISAAATAIYSMRYLIGMGDRSPDILANAFARPFLYLHIAGASTALLVGPLGFVARRLGIARMHIWIGRIYCSGCILGGASGFFVAFGSTAGPIATAGFGTLALLWTYVTWRGWRLALQRRFAEHRVWMIRSYALTFAAVTLRIGLPVAPALGHSFVDGYRALSFLSWTINLAVVEVYLAYAAGLLPFAGSSRDRRRALRSGARAI